MTKRFSTTVACAALSAALLSAGAHAQTPDPTAPTTAPTDTTTPPMTMPPTDATTPMGTASGTPMAAGANLNDADRLFMVRAAQGDMGEIQTSQMALKKSKTDSVKQVGQTLISGHSQSLKEGMGLGLLLGLTPPKDAGSTNMAVAAQLQGAGSKDFDKKYMADQVEAHENTIALYNMELSQGQDPQVKAFAAKYLPGIEGHTQMIYQVAGQVMAPGTALRPAAPPTVPGYAPSMAPVSADTPATATTPAPPVPTPAPSMPGMSGMNPTTTPGTMTTP